MQPYKDLTSHIHVDRFEYYVSKMQIACRNSLTEIVFSVSKPENK